MIVYRKLKAYKKESAIIDQGIKVYENFYNSKVKKSKKIIEISNKLAKSFGFIDKKGNKTYDLEPIGKWKIRRLTVRKNCSRKRNDGEGVRVKKGA